MSLLNELAADLQAGSLGTVATDIFVSHFPEDPNNILSLHNNQAGLPIRAMANTLDHEVPIVQVIARNVDHDTAEAKIRAVFERWDRFSGTLGGKRYLSILALHSPIYLAVDENNRFRWSCSFTVRRDPS